MKMLSKYKKIALLSFGISISSFVAGRFDYYPESRMKELAKTAETVTLEESAEFIDNSIDDLESITQGLCLFGKEEILRLQREARFYQNRIEENRAEEVIHTINYGFANHLESCAEKSSPERAFYIIAFAGILCSFCSLAFEDFNAILRSNESGRNSRTNNSSYW